MPSNMYAMYINPTTIIKLERHQMTNTTTNTWIPLDLRAEIHSLLFSFLAVPEEIIHTYPFRPVHKWVWPMGVVSGWGGVS